MSTISAGNLWVIYTNGISGDLENLYTDRNEAEAEAQRGSNTTFAGMQLSYSVMSLAEYIQECESEARFDGAQNERESHDMSTD